MKYPFTKKVDVVDDYHSIKVADPYRWLEDPNSEETKDWLSGQVALTNQYFSKIPMLRKIKEMVRKAYDCDRYDVGGVPTKYKDMIIFKKATGFEQSQKLFIHDVTTGKEELLFDPQDYAKCFASAFVSDVSENGKYCIIAVNKSGSDWHELRVMEIATRKLLPGSINWTKGNARFYQDGFFYVVHGQLEQGNQVHGEQGNIVLKFHKLFTDVANDEMVFGESDVLPDIEDNKSDTSFMTVSLACNNKCLVVSILQLGDSVYVKKLDKPDEKFQRLFWFEPGTEAGYAGSTADKLIFNHKGEIIIVDPKSPDKDNWVVINKDKSTNIYFAAAANGKIFTHVIQAGDLVMHQFNDKGQLERVYPAPVGCVYSWWPSKFKNDNKMLVSEASFEKSTRYHLLDIETGCIELIKESKPGVIVSDFQVSKSMYKSKDGTMVPITVFHKKGLDINGKTPTILYGYGGYGHIVIPQFSVRIQTFLELGGVYAIAGIRGGGEFGSSWHLAGCRGNKQNSFDDFIAAGEWLINQNYTDKNHLTILGASNGGTLVGACMNQRPDLFAAAIAMVGLYDKLRYHKFSIGKAFIREGGCADKPEEFKWLYAYSPIHNVKPGTEYPATLIVTNSDDNRCPPLHSFKFASTLQDAQASENPILLRYFTQGGHGLKPLDKMIEETAEILAFVFVNTSFEPKFV